MYVKMLIFVGFCKGHEIVLFGYVVMCVISSHKNEGQMKTHYNYSENPLLVFSYVVM